MADYYAHESAIINPGAEIGPDTKGWHFAHICDGAVIGGGCSFGQNTIVAGGVKVGGNVKGQNNVAIYTGTEIEYDVFLGPSCVLTKFRRSLGRGRRLVASWMPLTSSSPC